MLVLQRKYSSNSLNIYTFGCHEWAVLSHFRCSILR